MALSWNEIKDLLYAHCQQYIEAKQLLLEEDYSYALIENIGSVEFQIRIESSEKNTKQFLIQSKNIVVIKLIKKDVLYFDALTSEKARAKIKYTIDDGELPPLPPPHRPKSSAYPLH